MPTRSIPTGFHGHKYHALGNDYLVVDPAEQRISLKPEAIAALCDRNMGVGSDGILYGPLLGNDSPFPEDERGDFALRIFNPDGSEAEKSGNGLRIFSLYLYESGRVDTAPFSVMTRGGSVESRVFPGGSGARTIEISMGAPRFLPGDDELSFDGMTFRAVRVSMGNPHCVLLGHTPTRELAHRIGPMVETHPSFPQRTNVQFLEVRDRANIRIEIWERGAGYTLASGTSSCAAAAAAKHLGLVDDFVTVHMPGGELELDMSAASILMRGPAVRVFDALFSPSMLDAARERQAQ